MEHVSKSGSPPQAVDMAVAAVTPWALTSKEHLIFALTFHVRGLAK
jgi:hypothetical protein